MAGMLALVSIPQTGTPAFSQLREKEEAFAEIQVSIPQTGTPAFSLRDGSIA